MYDQFVLLNLKIQFSIKYLFFFFYFIPSVFAVLGGFNALPIIETCSRCPLERKNALPLRIS